MPDGAPRNAADLLSAYAKAHDVGTEGRGWETLAALFADDGVMRFEGISAGPYAGRGAILAGFREHGPRDRLLVDPPRALGTERATASYRWTTGPGVPEGTIDLAAKDGRIAELVVRKAPPPRT